MTNRFHVSFVTRHFIVLSILSVIASTSIGCAPLNLMTGGDDYNPSDSASIENANRPAPARCQVVIDSGWGAPKATTLEITQAMTVQDAIEQAKAIRRFGSIKVELLRMTPNSQRPLRLPVDFEPRKKSIRVEQDYALLPNDRIMVTHTSSSALDGFLGGMLPQ